MPMQSARLQCSLLRRLVLADTRKFLGMRADHVHQVEHVQHEQQDCEPDVDLVLLHGYFARCEHGFVDARQGHADDGDEHHRAVNAGRLRIELQRVVAKSAEQEAEPQDQQQVEKDCADQRRGHHRIKSRLQRHDADDQFREVPESGIEQAADRIAGVVRKVLGAVPDQSRDRDDRKCGDEELDGIADAGMLQPHCNRHEHEHPVLFPLDGLHRHPPGWFFSGIRGEVATEREVQVHSLHALLGLHAQQVHPGTDVGHLLLLH